MTSLSTRCADTRISHSWWPVERGGKRDKVLDIRIKSRHTEIDAGLREGIVDKMTRAANVDENVSAVDVVVSEEGGRRTDARFRIEVSTSAHGRHIRVVAEAATGEAALDDAADRFSRQLRRLKERLIDGSRRPVVHPDDDLGEEDFSQVVRVKQFVMKPMTVAEASLQMEMLGHAFFFFLDGERGNHSVLYRRADGRLGLIEAS